MLQDPRPGTERAARQQSDMVITVKSEVGDRNLSLSRVGLYDYCTTMESSSMTQKKIPVISKSLALCYIAVVDDYFDVS